MNTYLKVKQTYSTSISPDLYKKLYSLNLRNNGSMRYTLVHSKTHMGTPVFYIEQKSKILAWGLFNIINSDIYQINLYTRKAHRRRGLGKILKESMMEYLQQNNKKVMYAFVDKENELFWGIKRGSTGWKQIRIAI